MKSSRYDTTLTNRTGALRREVSSAFGLLVLFLNIWAGALLAARPVPAGPFAERFVICTDFGMATVDQDGRPTGPAAPAGAGSLHCPLCLPVSHGLAPGVVALVSPVSRTPVLNRTIPPSDPVLPTRPVAHASARAPPLS